jgi:hypothetical protein
MKLILAYLKIFFWSALIGSVLIMDYVAIFKPEVPMMEALKGGLAGFIVVMLNGVITAPLYWLAFRNH